VNAATLSSWREVFLGTVWLALKSRETDVRDEKTHQHRRGTAACTAGVGELYNERWMIQRHGYISPAQRRREYYTATRKECCLRRLELTLPRVA